MTLSTLTVALMLAGAPTLSDTPPAETVPAGEISASTTAAAVAPALPQQFAAADVPTLPQQFASADMPALPAPPSSDALPADEAQDAIVVTARHHTASDPLEAVNMKSFAITQAVDAALVRPLAKTYQRILPDPVRSGFRNILNNLREPVAFLNFLLQFKPGKAVETAARFALNSTIGAAGLFDMAKRHPFGLPRRINGFAYTLGFYGVKPGAYLYLPLIGPTTLRDFIGDGLDRLFLPFAVGKPFSKPVYATSVGAFSSLDQRAEFDEKLEALHHGDNPYADTRADYLRHRQSIIDGLHNKRPDADLTATGVIETTSPAKPNVAP